MPQFYVPRKNIRGNFFVFEESESHHLSKVLRKKKDDIIQIFDGHGFVSQARITDVTDQKKVQAELVSVHPKKSSSIVLRIFPALLKSERFNWMLEKAAELGVASIHPVCTNRTIVQIPSHKLSAKHKHWRQILLSASKQCGRPEIPEIDSPVPFQQAISKLREDDLNLILWEGEEKCDLGSLLADAVQVAPNFSSICLITGPEGGFTLEEISEAKKCRIKTVRLGDNILRAETAVLASISLCLLGTRRKNS